MYKLKSNIGSIKIGSLITITKLSSQKDIKRALKHSPNLISNFEELIVIKNKNKDGNQERIDNN